MASSHRSSAAAGFVLVAALATLSACSSDVTGDRDSREDETASSGPTPQPTGGPTKDPADERATQNADAWTKVREWKRGEQDSFGLSAGKRVLLWPSPTGPATASVQTARGDALLEHPMLGPTWSIQDGYLSGDFAVYVNVEPEQLEVSVTAYRVSTGDRVDTSATEEGFLGPETDVNESRLAYALGRPQEGMCLHVLDLDSGADTEVLCEKRGAQLGDLALAGDTLGYSRLASEDAGGRCKSVQFLQLRGDVPATHEKAAERAAHESEPCGNWSPAPLASGAIAWDNASPELNLPSGQLFAFSDNQVTELGGGYTDSARACGDWLFWTRPGLQQFSEILGWRPGLSEPTVVRPEEENVELTTPYCADDRWLTTRADNISGSNETLALWTLDTSRLR